MDYPDKITETVYILGYHHLKIHLIVGNKACALIDTGVSASTDLLVRQLDKLGHRPDYIVVTHPHGDHINGLPGLREAFPEAKVIAGAGAPDFVSHPKIAPTYVHDDRFMTTYLNERGIKSILSPLAAPPTLEDCTAVRGGYTLDLGGTSLEFIEVGGHAPGGLAVYLRKEKILLPSDSLGFYLPSGEFFPIYFTGYGDYMSTIDRLAGLGAQIVSPAHLGLFKGEEARRCFSLAASNAAAMRDRLAADPRDDETVVDEIFREFYRDELLFYPRENIIGCCRLLLRRSREA
ncbi:MAG TPA: MBL fold metallo-hydrolase [Syntrophales bacterium]|nr:MBL fold metallo-hydrolase [Syntrophales bacterium]HOM07260.1 MBL fold metallo-hydrolase [Syntrophales bacterium]HON99740.1 MBL fold metallo-hydrolase [Syntrophales bacterium]HPC01267.1 MBL fold metallo-hydrolase [Syntrophales bacterium]HPQ06923.1 MBL fold metallo-hydrolase [Syntrophales bacterium]